MKYETEELPHNNFGVMIIIIIIIVVILTVITIITVIIAIRLPRSWYGTNSCEGPLSNALIENPAQAQTN